MISRVHDLRIKSPDRCDATLFIFVSSSISLSPLASRDSTEELGLYALLEKSEQSGESIKQSKQATCGTDWSKSQ